MTGLTPYLHFDGTAREALAFYRDVFGGEVVLNTFEDAGRTDGDASRIAHGMLQGRVELFAADTEPGGIPSRLEGTLFALLGTAEPDELREWFARLSEGGEVIDPLALKPWGDHDGQVRDRYGIVWLIGFQG